MRNKFKGRCSKCGCEVLPKKGRWHTDGYEVFGRDAQKFSGLRCLKCSTTTKKGLKALTNN